MFDVVCGIEIPLFVTEFESTIQLGKNAGTGMSSGVNFAIPIDTVLRTIPALIVYGTPYNNRY